VLTSGTLSPIQAETGKGTDIFKVILSIFDIQPTTGDVVAIVSVNGESKVKAFDTANIAVNATPSGGIIEYVATFPNVNVNIGDEYKACALILKDLNKDSLKCTSGNNSPAKRAEYVDLSLAGDEGEAAAETDASGGSGGGDDASGGSGGGDDASGGSGGGDDATITTPET
jgi:uncharacterized membrane protein YgcG